MFKKTLLLFFLFVVFLFPALFFYWWHQATQPVDVANKKSQIIVVLQGWGVDDIGRRLKEESLIKDIFAFKIMVAKEGISDSLQAGDFRLSPSMNLFEISQTLTHGTLDVWVTIPEGLRREEVANIIQDNFAKQSAGFNTNEFVNKTKSLEGYLFPDTYLIPKDAGVDDVIEILQDNFEKKFASIKPENSLSKHQTVVLASLIEREAKHDEERSIVGGILIKRLKKGWPLQVDASIQYAKASAISHQPSAIESIDWWPKATLQDLKIESLYNTYENVGLPPAPICNPSVSSLKAASDPQESDYWFYLSDPSGNMHYAETLEEHEENIKQYLQE